MKIRQSYHYVIFIRGILYLEWSHLCWNRPQHICTEGRWADSSADVRAHFNIKTVFPGMWISIIQLRELWDDPDGKVHGANMGHIWADRTQVGPMLAPWTLLYGCLIFIIGILKLLRWDFYTDTAPKIPLQLYLSRQGLINWKWQMQYIHPSILPWFKQVNSSPIYNMI